MLILTRKINQSIILSVKESDVTIMILGVERDRVKIGISAPSEVYIVREELLT